MSNKNLMTNNHQVRSVYDAINGVTSFLTWDADGQLSDIMRPCLGEISARAIWLSPDPLLGKYPYISPYAYCHWNPMKYVDPDGRIIKFASDTTKTQKQQFWETIRHLDALNCGGRYGQLKQSKITYIIDMNSEKSQFVIQKSKMPTIYWNPK